MKIRTRDWHLPINQERHVSRSRLFYGYLVCSLLALGAGGSTVGAKDDTRPNILFIYTDDQSTRTVSSYADAYAWVDTPHIDGLAKQGVRFENAYIGSWCMPSRASLLTGHHQYGIESMRMDGAYPGSSYDYRQCPFWPAVFRGNGYQTAHIGKWHTGTDTGFGRDWDYQKVWNRPRFVDNAEKYYYDQLISTNGEEAVMTEGYSTDNYTDWAVDYIEGEGRAADKPWYLWLCYGAVHAPFTPADRHLDDYADAEIPDPVGIYGDRDGKPEYVQNMNFWEKSPEGWPAERSARAEADVPTGMVDLPGRRLKDWVRQYQQGVLAIDEGVGRLMVALKESGQDENTLVVFTSDQGFAWGQYGFKSKVAPYRASVAAPLIIRPVEINEETRGKVVTDAVSGVDLVPTFFAQAGMEPPWKMHGRDLSPLLKDDKIDWEQPAMVVHTAKEYGSAADVVPGPDDKRLYHGPGVPWYVMYAEGRYKYVRTLVPGEVEELYDMQADLQEEHNLVQNPRYTPLVKRLRKATMAELKRTDAKLVSSLPPVAPLED